MNTLPPLYWESPLHCVFCVPLPHFFLPVPRWNINKEDGTLTHILSPALPISRRTHSYMLSHTFTLNPTHMQIRKSEIIFLINADMQVPVWIQCELGLCNAGGWSYFAPTTWEPQFIFLVDWWSCVRSFPITCSSDHRTRSEYLPFNNQFASDLSKWHCQTVSPSPRNICQSSLCLDNFVRLLHI